ncbi:MAG: restriction endonuclease [Chloroflexi bacterium]|nr:restriction endonuclease [Chloroflexota bacterium]
MTKYRRSFEELEHVASKFWPTELSDKEAKLSVIPLLLRTQDQFLSILSIEIADINKLFEIIESSNLHANQFVKHLAILADVGGELLNRISNEFEMIFPTGKLKFSWGNKEHTYEFRILPKKRFSNPKLHIDGKNLLERHDLDDLKCDAVAILLFGSLYQGSDSELSSALSKCEVGEYIGNPGELTKFVKQRYLWVSRITGGAQANSLGQLAQQFVSEYVEAKLGLDGLEVKSGGRLPGVTHTDPDTGRETSFDIVVSYGGKHVAIEVSFQVTTNSTIERKSGQARDRFEQVKAAGHRITYVIDGAGNFERETAMKVILNHSHCSVAFSKDELNLLCEFIRKFFQE